MQALLEARSQGAGGPRPRGRWHTGTHTEGLPGHLREPPYRRKPSSHNVHAEIYKPSFTVSVIYLQVLWGEEEREQEGYR